MVGRGGRRMELAIRAGRLWPANGIRDSRGTFMAGEWNSRRSGFQPVVHLRGRCLVAGGVCTSGQPAWTMPFGQSALFVHEGGRPAEGQQAPNSIRRRAGDTRRLRLVVHLAGGSRRMEFAPEWLRAKAARAGRPPAWTMPCGQSALFVRGGGRPAEGQQAPNSIRRRPVGHRRPEPVVHSLRVASGAQAACVDDAFWHREFSYT